ncbi:MAG: hypothetical protein JWN56_2972 [Sphingobacteriales bacterium]|nr:hypothetical protein [Sphingobacteriales bacterium]
MNSMKRILVVDDDVDVAEEVKWLLNEEGYITGCANKLTGIWDIIEEFRPHLILLDISMPDGDGRDLCKRLKSTPLTAEIPVIIFSSHPYIYDTIEMVQANDVITKPFKKEIFLDRVKKQLAKNYSSSGQI